MQTGKLRPKNERHHRESVAGLPVSYIHASSNTPGNLVAPRTSHPLLPYITHSLTDLASALTWALQEFWWKLQGRLLHFYLRGAAFSQGG